MRWLLWLGVPLAGCAYQPGSFAHERAAFPGTRTTVGCLDVAIDRRADLGKTAVLGYRFGNRCDRPAIVDLAYVHVVGRTGDGVEHALTPYDPQGALMAVKLDGRFAGSEALAYPSEEPLVQVCVDAASLAQRTPARWLCFARIDRDGAPYTEPEPPAADQAPAADQVAL